MDPADMLFHWLAPTIRIEADPELFVFTNGDKVFSAEPSFHTSGDTVLAVGAHYDGETPAETIHLFRHPMQRPDSTRCLESFLRHGIYVVSKHGWRFRKPKLRFVVSANMIRFTSGFHESIFKYTGSNSINAWQPDWVTVTTEG